MMHKTFLRKIENMIFDLDGTLIDSAGDIIDCLDQAFLKVCPLLVGKVDRSQIGPPVSEIVKAVGPGLNDEQVTAVVRAFRECYDNSSMQKTLPYAGVKELLSGLAQEEIQLFVITNKPLASTMKILALLKINSFREVVTPDVVEDDILSKGEMVRCLLDRWNLDHERTILVGDSTSDIIAAHQNKILVVAVSYGYGKVNALQNAKPDFVINKSEDLLNLIFS